MGNFSTKVEKMTHKGRLAGVLSGQGRYAGQERVLPDLQVSTAQGKSGDRCWEMRRIIALRRSLQGELSSPSGGSHFGPGWLVSRGQGRNRSGRAWREKDCFFSDLL